MRRGAQLLRHSEQRQLDQPGRYQGASHPLRPLTRVALPAVCGHPHDPKESHWHIGPIGVAPALQGQGVGKAILGSFLEMAGKDRSIANLETDVDRNLPLTSSSDSE